MKVELPPPPSNIYKLILILSNRGKIEDLTWYIQAYQGRIQEFSMGEVQKLFKKKSSGTWAPTQSQVPCLFQK